MDMNTHTDTQIHRIHSCEKKKKKKRESGKQNLQRQKFVMDN